jgi:hypothetical protein
MQRNSWLGWDRLGMVHEARALQITIHQALRQYLKAHPAIATAQVGRSGPCVTSNAGPHGGCVTVREMKEGPSCARINPEEEEVEPSGSLQKVSDHSDNARLVDRSGPANLPSGPGRCSTGDPIAGPRYPPQFVSRGLRSRSQKVRGSFQDPGRIGDALPHYGFADAAPAPFTAKASA